VELVAAIALGTFILPFLIGWWIGNPVFAAAAWGALGLTLLIRQVQLEGGEDQGLLLLSIVVGSALSAGSAGYGGHVREKQRRRRAEEGR